MTTSVHRVRNIVVEAKQRPLSPGHRLPDIFYSRFLSLLPCRFHFFPFWSGLIYRSLGVASEPSQECLPGFRESPNGESPGCCRESLSLSARVTWWLSCKVLSGHLSLWDSTVGSLGHSVPSVARRDHWGKRHAFLSASASQYSHSMVGRRRVVSVISQEALSYSSLGYIVRNWKILTLQKAWLQYKWGTPKNVL